MAATLKTPNYQYPQYAENDNTSWADFNSLADGVDRDIHNVSQIVQEEKGKTQELIENMGEVQEQVARAAQDAGEAKTQVAAINVRVENAETHLNDVDNQIELLQTSQETQAGNIASLEQDVEEAKTNITSTANKVETLTQQINNTSDLVGQHGTDITQLKQDTAEYETRISDVETEVSEVSGEVASAEANITSIRNDVESIKLKKIIASENQELSISESEVAGSLKVTSKVSGTAAYMLRFRLEDSSGTPFQLDDCGVLGTDSSYIGSRNIICGTYTALSDRVAWINAIVFITAPERGVGFHLISGKGEERLIQSIDITSLYSLKLSLN